LRASLARLPVHLGFPCCGEALVGGFPAGVCLVGGAWLPEDVRDAGDGPAVSVQLSHPRLHIQKQRFDDCRRLHQHREACR
jgi:hypothetical protein